jgi:hypothetical protein
MSMNARVSLPKGVGGGSISRSFGLPTRRGRRKVWTGPLGTTAAYLGQVAERSVYDL